MVLWQVSCRRIHHIAHIKCKLVQIRVQWYNSYESMTWHQVKYHHLIGKMVFFSNENDRFEY